jgi:hypothetical protein
LFDLQILRFILLSHTSTSWSGAGWKTWDMNHPHTLLSPHCSLVVMVRRPRHIVVGLMWWLTWRWSLMLKDQWLRGVWHRHRWNLQRLWWFGVPFPIILTVASTRHLWQRLLKTKSTIWNLLYVHWLLPDIRWSLANIWWRPWPHVTNRLSTIWSLSSSSHVLNLTNICRLSHVWNLLPQVRHLPHVWSLAHSNVSGLSDDGSGSTAWGQVGVMTWNLQNGGRRATWMMGQRHAGRHLHHWCLYMHGWQLCRQWHRWGQLHRAGLLFPQHPRF